MIFVQGELRYRRTWLVLGWIAVAVALVLNLMPSAFAPTVVNDKFEHTLGYVLLTLWFCGTLPRSRFWLVAVGLLVMGIGVEILQDAMRWGRQADVRDVVADAAGIAIGLALALTVLAEWPRRVEALLASGASK